MANLTKTTRIEPSVPLVAGNAVSYSYSKTATDSSQNVPSLVALEQMSFWSAISNCLSKYATFSGRSSRSEYWQFFLAVNVLANSAIFLDANLIMTGVLVKQGTLLLFGLVVIVFCFPLFAASWRRMHDVGRSGWTNLVSQVSGLALLTSPVWLSWILSEIVGTKWSVLLLARGRRLNFEVPELFYVLLVISIFLLFLPLWWLSRPSQPGPNRYGPNPHEVPQ
jgi:uncharacterized membrane protein YhaH (DUF805 family)